MDTVASKPAARQARNKDKKAKPQGPITGMVMPVELWPHKDREYWRAGTDPI